MKTGPIVLAVMKRALRDHKLSFAQQKAVEQSVAQVVIRSSLSEAGIRLTSRHERAIDIAAGGLVKVDRKGGHHVQSSDGLNWYRIRSGRCTCPDETTECKHVLAVDMAQRYAASQGIELVLHFNDADEKTQPAEFWSPANVARKMQAGACMPLYITQGMDISEALVGMLNSNVTGN